jgi:HEPN domain-containing protein
MKNYSEAEKKLEDAEDFLKLAKIAFESGLYRGCIQNAQGCVELSAKAIISLFEEPKWTHDPSGQLISVVENFLSEIEGRERILEVAQASKELAPWHGKSVYGEFTNDSWLSAREIATEEKAKWALGLAERCFKIGQEFLKNWIREK